MLRLAVACSQLAVTYIPDGKHRGGELAARLVPRRFLLSLLRCRQPPWYVGGDHPGRVLPGHGPSRVVGWTLQPLPRGPLPALARTELYRGTWQLRE